MGLALGCKIKCRFEDKIENTRKIISAHHARASLCLSSGSVIPSFKVFN
jgi:hypothetical protein